ncbi:hypothetical protein WJ63_03905 [Burkholderia pyrrocinia]|nr:hypothetical protein WJ63_03905 [Burkholderia pyrrocinia]
MMRAVADGRQAHALRGARGLAGMRPRLPGQPSRNKMQGIRTFIEGLADAIVRQNHAGVPPFARPLLPS